MSYADNPYSSFGTAVIDAQADERADFIRKTYLHLTGAVLLYAGLLAALLQTNLPEKFMTLLAQSQYSWLLVLGAFMGVSWLANSWAMSGASKATQYAGLGLYVVAQAFITLPLVYYAHLQDLQNPDLHILQTAAILTVVTFIGLTIAAFATGVDFSFLKTGLILAGFGALGLIVCATIFGFNLGILFTVAMIVFAAAYILYDTSNVMYHYQVGQHVAAALALFAAVALLFFYILRLVMSLRR